MSKEKPKLLVIGSRGFLGSYVARAAGDSFEVVEANRTRDEQANCVGIDVRNKGSVNFVFQAIQPDVAVLLSAISDIDYCERVPDEAWAVNLRGAEYVADACARTNTRLVFTSTAAVFDGCQHGYSEESPLSPISVYGETKARAEKAVMALVPSAIVVRMALVLGFAGCPGTNALLENLRIQWASGHSVSLPEFEQRNPIDAYTAAKFMLDLLKSENARGIFHIGCKDSITRYDLGLKLASRMGYPDRVQPQREPLSGRAPRGADHYLLTDKLSTMSDIPIPTCDQVIERCFDGLA